MTWFRRSRNRGPADERLAREVGEALDPYEERALVIDGDQAMINASQILANIHDRMERADLDPSTSWAPEDLMSQEESAAMFMQLAQGELVVTETAWFARQILARWPADMVEHPIGDGAQIGMFLDGPRVDPGPSDLARRVLNRSLATHERVDKHPELSGLSAEELIGVYLALVFWFAIKSLLLNQKANS